MPPDAKPPKSSWKTDEDIWHKIESLQAYALDDFRNDAQKKTAELVSLRFGFTYDPQNFYYPHSFIHIKTVYSLCLKKSV